MRVLLIRHGPTAGNLEGRYIGRSDEPLCQAGAVYLAGLGVFSALEEVFVSGMQRTRQTALLLFPEARLLPFPGLNEMDFGAFEGRNAYDMREDNAYRVWVEGGCVGTCPGGESRAVFGQRVSEAFEEAMRLAFSERKQVAVFVLHGGSIMEIMQRYARPHRGYFDWQLRGGGCIQATAAAKDWAQNPHLSRAKVMEKIPL